MGLIDQTPKDGAKEATKDKSIGEESPAKVQDTYSEEEFENEDNVSD